MSSSSEEVKDDPSTDSVKSKEGKMEDEKPFHKEKEKRKNTSG